MTQLRFTLIQDNGCDLVIRAHDLRQAAAEAVNLCSEAETGGTLYLESKPQAFIVEQVDAINGYVATRKGIPA